MLWNLKLNLNLKNIMKRMRYNKIEMIIKENKSDMITGLSKSRWNLSITTIFVIFILTVIQSAECQLLSLSNTPPVIDVERNWRISETELVGSRIATVRAKDAENDLLQFDLEPLFHGNYANPNEKGTTKNRLPFRIDPNTGVVYLNESLAGRGGENFFLYITVSDGQLTAKNEIYVNIYGKNDKNIYGSRSPSLAQATQNLSQLFPPFHMLPGVQSIRDQQHPQIPINFGNGGIISGSTGAISNSNNDGGVGIQYPTGSFNTPPSSQTFDDINNGPYSTYEPSSDIIHQTGIINHQPTTSTNAVKDNNSNNIGGNVTANKTMNRMNTSTKLRPIINSDNESNNNRNSNRRQFSNQDHNNRGGNGGNGDDNDNETGEFNNGKIEKSQESSYTIKAIIPIVITICGIFVAITLITIFIYRRHLCAIGKTFKKKSKEEMTKKSNQSNISSNITDDSRNSMVLQHWNGPMAFCNRYVPWDRENQQLSLATSQLSTSSSIGGNSQIKLDKWEFPRHRLKFFNILGEGAFGQVWRCEATDIDGKEGVTTVAVKTLKENATEIERNDLHSELQVMKSLEPHVNVVRLLGCCTDKDPIFVVIEYVNRGKLQTYLRNSRAERHYGNTHGKSNVLTSGDLTSFMYQVAKGMDFLTSRGIIHRDLAARNILITDDHTCKVADFGFARDVITSKVYERKSEGKLPIRWMAIESLYDNIFSVKSDIWSFGILMWEIVTLGSTPYPGISAADVMRKVRDGYRLEKPDHCRRELYNIMYYCWAKNSNERPTFHELVQLLDKLLHTEMDYIELERFPDHNYYNMQNLSDEKL